MAFAATQRAFQAKLTHFYMAAERQRTDLDTLLHLHRFCKKVSPGAALQTLRGWWCSGDGWEPRDAALSSPRDSGPSPMRGQGGWNRSILCLSLEKRKRQQREPYPGGMTRRRVCEKIRLLGGCSEPSVNTSHPDRTPVLFPSHRSEH